MVFEHLAGHLWRGSVWPGEPYSLGLMREQHFQQRLVDAAFEEPPVLSRVVRCIRPPKQADVCEAEVLVLTEKLGLQDVGLKVFVRNSLVERKGSYLPDIVVNLLLGGHSREQTDQVSIDGPERHAELVAVLCQELSLEELGRLVGVSRRDYSLLEISGAEGSVHHLDIVRGLHR